MEESIYNLIPRPAEQFTKPPMYRSKHNARMPPSCSSIGLSGTTKLTSNESGSDQCVDGAAAATYSARRPHATFGKELLGSISPQDYLKKRVRTLPPISEVHKFQRSVVSPTRPPVPKMSEKPVMGLVAEKNFIVSNAVDNILAVPKKTAKPMPLFVNSASFGKPPKYLQKIKHQIESEYALITEANKQQAAGEVQRMRLMTEAERDEIVSGLKKKWDDTHKQYQSLTFNIDTVTKVQRKEGLEVEMEQIEKAIQKLSKKNIYVYDDSL
eukprot:RCo044447